MATFTLKISTLDIWVFNDDLESLIYAVDVTVTYAPLQATIFAVDATAAYTPLTATITALDATVTYDLLRGMLTELDATITYDLLRALFTEMDVDVVYSTAVAASLSIIPATSAAPRIEVPSLPNVTASLVPAVATTGTPGSIGIIDIVELASAAAGLARCSVGDIYWRIWVVPSFLRPQNPERNVDIPFIVWQAYPYDNALASIGGSGQTGLTLDLSAPEPWVSCEERTVNLQIGDLAPTAISAIYLFNFTTGQGVFLFETTLAAWLWAVPEVPVVERWSWLTDVIQSHDSTEQRVRVRKQPRRTMEFMLLIENDAARALLLERWYSYLNGIIAVPFYQYATKITTTSAVGTSKIFFDPAATDMRDGEFVVIYQPDTETSYLITLDALEADGATTASPLTAEIRRNDVIAPAANCRIADKTGPEMGAITGTLNVSVFATEPRMSFTRPGSSAIIATFDGLNVLEPRTLAPADEMVDMNVTVIDNNSGLTTAKSSWSHALISGRREFRIARILEPVRFDYWRDFFDEAGGRQVSFLMSTWRRDLTLAVIPGPSDPQIIVNGTTYGSQFWPHDTYKRLQLETSEGTVIWRKVTAVADYPGGLTLLTLDVALPADDEWGSDFIISFLQRVRLAADEVVLTHDSLDTMLEFAVRTTDQ